MTQNKKEVYKNMKHMQGSMGTFIPTPEIRLIHFQAQNALISVLTASSSWLRCGLFRVMISDSPEAISSPRLWRGRHVLHLTSPRRRTRIEPAIITKYRKQYKKLDQRHSRTNRIGRLVWAATAQRGWQKQIGPVPCLSHSSAWPCCGAHTNTHPLMQTLTTFKWVGLRALFVDAWKNTTNKASSW